MKLTHTLHMIDLASCQQFRQLKPVVILASFEAVQLKLQLVLCHYLKLQWKKFWAHHHFVHCPSLLELYLVLKFFVY